VVEIKVHEIKPMFSRRTLAEYLALNRYTVRDLQRDGRIPPPDLMIANRPRWRYETVESLVRKGRI